MSLVGNLQDLGLGEILQIVSLSRKSGTLTLRSEGRVGTVVFRQGQVVRSSSSTFKQSLGSILLSKSLVDQETLQKALVQQQTEGFRERLGVILINSYGVSQETIEDVVREQIESIVFSMFEWVTGSFEFIAQDYVESVDGTRMDPLQFMLEQGLNPQFLALEGTRIYDERRNADSISSADAGCDDGTSVDPLPGGDSDSAPATASAPAMVSGVDKLLVVVDDDGPTLRLLAESLRENDYDVHAMSSSEETLVKVDSLIRTGRRPMVLVDLIMPKMDGSGVLGGVELLELLHNNYKNLPIIVMTDYHLAEAEKKVCDMGYHFILKPRRAEIGDKIKREQFIPQLLTHLQSAVSGDAAPKWQTDYHLGDEIRFDIDVQDPAAHAVKDDAVMFGESTAHADISNGDAQDRVLFLALRFSSEFLSRTIVFIVKDGMVSGVAQSGVRSGMLDGDELVRSIHIPLASDHMFSGVFESRQAAVFSPWQASMDTRLFELLGGNVPSESFLGPIISNSRVIGFLYGDNLPEDKPIGTADLLKTFLSHVGQAM